jgi:hypothetical protein
MNIIVTVLFPYFYCADMCSRSFSKIWGFHSGDGGGGGGGDGDLCLGTM